MFAPVYVPYMKFSVLRALSEYLLLRHDTVVITPFNVVFSPFLISVLCGDNVRSLWFISDYFTE